MVTRSVGLDGSSAATEIAREKIQNKALKAKSGESVKSQSAEGVGVRLSDDAKSLSQAKSKALEIAMNTSPIREDKVAHFKSLIANGSYDPNAEGIADGMLKEALKDYQAKNQSRE
tara:strand:- start:1449 stop:1796 length:348 start_codon:yes stop_codon:yes gene_type:complete